ncbi:MAG: Hsp20/alpha crystallin family protein [Vicinamibacterales bacterium]
MARIFLERRDMDDDLRRLFDQITGTNARPHAAECSVPLDVVETPHGVEVVLDLVGVEPDAVQVVIARDTLVITGVKRAAACAHHGEATFHVAERVFGRFARAVRLTGAFDVARGDATLRAGELRVRLPRIEERRGREHRIPVRAD